MPQPVSPKTHWLSEASSLAAALADVPSRPLRLGSARVPLDDDLACRLRHTQEKLIEFLNYRAKRELGGATPRVTFTESTPQHVIRLRNALAKAGMLWTEADHAALNAHFAISFILNRHYADAAMKAELPVALAAVAGQTVSPGNAKRAKAPRGQRNDVNAELRSAKRKHRNSGLSWKQILLQLEGDRLVLEWDDVSITWRAESGVERRTPTATFKNWH
jgi:hypothetical protein